MLPPPARFSFESRSACSRAYTSGRTHASSAAYSACPAKSGRRSQSLICARGQAPGGSCVSCHLPLHRRTHLKVLGERRPEHPRDEPREPATRARAGLYVGAYESRCRPVCCSSVQRCIACSHCTQGLSSQHIRFSGGGASRGDACIISEVACHVGRSSLGWKRYRGGARCVRAADSARCG